MKNLDELRAIANAVLYEGSMLYPYRASALKNQRPGWSFGSLLPPVYAEANPGESDAMSAEVLAVAGSDAVLTVQARFLQLLPTRQQDRVGAEREVLLQASLADLLTSPQTTPFQFDEVRGVLEIAADDLTPEAVRISIAVRNRSVPETPPMHRDEALRHALISAHALVALSEGEFISLFDPPEAWRTAADDCRRQGVFPVLVGDPAERRAMLVSPIILYDFPAIAPESRGDFFDSAEMDEMLTLRVLTLTEEEKQQMRDGDAGSRAILERVEQASAPDLLDLHGVIRNRRPSELEWKPGDRVRLWPKRRADLFDVVLAGKVATVESVENTVDDETYLAVTVDDDPGADLGVERQIGHRFFFRADEVEPLESGPAD